MAAWGQNLIANPRNGAIYTWTNNTASRAVVVANAPVQVTYALVSPTRQVFALGCNQEASPYSFDPLVIRHSSIGNNTEWNTSAATTAREYRLPGGGRIVCGAVIGENLLVWTSDALFLGTFVVPIGSFIAAIIMLSNWNPTLRTFAYAWTLFYFVLELMLVINIKDNALIAWSVFNVLTWASAYTQNVKRIAIQNLERLAKGLLAAAAIGTAVAS
jgi:hypothetical protein